MSQGHQIVITPGNAHVEVVVGGTKIAESDRPVILEETGLPARYYLPPADVFAGLLEPTATATTCPFKGQASYWAAVVDGERHEDVAWSYEEPIPAAKDITGLVCFYPDRTELTVDGKRV